MKTFKKKTVREESQNVKRQVGRSQRELDRERARLEREETKLLAQIKKQAKISRDGANDVVLRALAKQLVQIRNQKAKFIQMSSNLGRVKLTAVTMASNEVAAQQLKASGKAISRVNKASNPAKMMATMAAFERNMESINLNEELMNDSLAQLDQDDEVDDITNQVLDEIGVDLGAKLGHAPTDSLTTQKQENNFKRIVEDDILEG